MTNKLATLDCPRFDAVVPWLNELNSRLFDPDRVIYGDITTTLNRHNEDGVISFPIAGGADGPSIVNLPTTVLLDVPNWCEQQENYALVRIWSELIIDAHEIPDGENHTLSISSIVSSVGLLNRITADSNARSIGDNGNANTEEVYLPIVNGQVSVNIIVRLAESNSENLTPSGILEAWRAEHRVSIVSAGQRRT